MTSIRFPEPKYRSDMSIEQALLERRSIRDYGTEPLTFADVGQLLWAAQGITKPGGYTVTLRTAPSAGALYPLELYLAVGNADDLLAGVYKYEPLKHALNLIAEGDIRDELCRAALRQSCIRDAAMVMVFSAVYERATKYYGERGIRYLYMEVGHAAQNVHLQVISLNLGTVVIGAFDDAGVKRILNMEDNEEPLYLMPIGRL